jgi:hypothetical protein
MTMTEPRAFIHFVKAVMFSVIDAQRAMFGSAATARTSSQVASADATTLSVAEAPVGSVATTGDGCYSSNSIVLQPEQGFPGASRGNC